MKIIIPMTGFGSRFVAAGYKDLKPLIKVQGLPVIEWIVKGMYKEEEDFLFICREEHINKIPGMYDLLRKIAPHGDIYQVDNWVKKGPVFDVMQASSYIDDSSPCIVNYCDFYMTWDYISFCKSVKERKCEGSIPCYTGFHPHLFHSNNYYASCLVDNNENLIKIREKYSFEKDKTKALHSPGTYYFNSGETLKKYSSELLQSNQVINGEYYTSLIYNYIVRGGGKVWVPANVEKFCQWGTPEDLSEYLFWTDIIRRFHND